MRTGTKWGGIRTWKAPHFGENHTALKILALVGDRTFKQDLGSGIVKAIYALREPDAGLDSLPSGN